MFSVIVKMQHIEELHIRAEQKIVGRIENVLGMNFTCR